MIASQSEDARGSSVDRAESLVGSLLELSTNDDDSSTEGGRQQRRRRRRRRRRHKSKHRLNDQKSVDEVSGPSRKQMIESLVRFSYHTPTAVLEDLITHEIQRCRQNGENPTQNEKTTYTKKDSVHVIKVEKDGESDSDVESISLSSLSSGEREIRQAKGAREVFAACDTNVHALPENRSRASALVFIDISGFTKLSTILDEETLSRVINSYFEMIIREVNAHGGDVLKFAGDALFVEWRVPEISSDKDNSGGSDGSNVLKDLCASLSSMSKTDRIISNAKGLPWAVLRATRCAAAIVQNYSDHEVVAPSHMSDSIGVLNVHCGIGAGTLIGIHTSDYQEEEALSEIDESVESRREYLFLGDAINQVTNAAHIALNGEVLIAPEALRYLTECCDVPSGMIDCQQPVCIASRGSVFLDLVNTREVSPGVPILSKNGRQVYESLRKHCQLISLASLSRLHSQIALYVHPAVRGDVWDSTGTNQQARSTDDIQQRHHTEAELRSVFTMFIKAIVAPDLTSDDRINHSLFATLRNIMQVTSRELDRFSGQLRQFIVDDKGVVLIAVFGLRGSTFSDMVASNALPACFAIQKALTAAGIEIRIGATFGKAYCGVVGALRRHEFSVMGAPVNLAARLMDSPMNNGILVEEHVRNEASGKYAFRSLTPVNAKGYGKPVGILEPVHALSSRPTRKSTSAKFVGREEEQRAILGFACAIIDQPINPQASVVNIVGDSGIGKSALVVATMNAIRVACLKKGKIFLSLRSTSTEDQQRIPLCAFRKILLGAIRELCYHDGSTTEYEGGLESGKKQIPPTFRPQDADESFSHAPRIQTFVAHGVPSSTRPMRPAISRSGSFVMNAESRTVRTVVRFPYLEKLRWACKEAGYHELYADLIGSQFLGIEDSTSITHINGSVPPISELVECIAQCFIKIVDFADIAFVFVDDFQWVDSFTWRVIRALSQSAKRMLIVRAVKAHDKRALRRLSNGMSKGVNSSMEITLGPLELDDIKDLISHIFSIPKELDAIDEDASTYIYQKTGGLPVYVIEVIETMKRTNAFHRDTDGKLRLTLVDNHGSEECSALVLNQMLNRFDMLDASVRKILHTCAVLGQSFSLSDVIRVHPEIKTALVEDSLNVALSEMILVDLGDDDEKSTCSTSTNAGCNSKIGSSVGHSKTSSRLDVEGERNFEFSHDTWRKTVLATLLKARKVKLHRLIAIAMEKELAGDALESSDLSRLLTLFEHWKLCGDFTNAAPLALMLGERLNEWDLVNQSVDICRDALDMSYQIVSPIDNKDPIFGEWVRVSSTKAVLQLIIRLHIRIAENYRLLGREMKCVRSYEDAYTILNSCSEEIRSMLIPVLSGLLSTDFEREEQHEQEIPGHESLLEMFVRVAQIEGDPIHLARALAMKSSYYADHGYFERALEDFYSLRSFYNAQEHSHFLRGQYGKDYAMEVFSQSILWLFLSGKESEAVDQGFFILKNHLPLQDPHDVNTITSLLLPSVLVLKFVGRGEDAHYIFCRYVVNAYHDFAPTQTYWVEIFNPLVYLLDIVKMEEADESNELVLEAILDWVLNDSNSYFSPHHLRLGHTLMGEMCYRLAQMKDADDPMRKALLQKARLFLTPIARDVTSEPFLAHSALAFLRVMD